MGKREEYPLQPGCPTPLDWLLPLLVPHSLRLATLQIPRFCLTWVYRMGFPRPRLLLAKCLLQQAGVSIRGQYRVHTLEAKIVATKEASARGGEVVRKSLAALAERRLVVEVAR